MSLLSKIGWLRRPLLAGCIAAAGLLASAGMTAPAQAQFYGGYGYPYYAGGYCNPYYGYGYGCPYYGYGYGESKEPSN